MRWYKTSSVSLGYLIASNDEANYKLANEWLKEHEIILCNTANDCQEESIAELLKTGKHKINSHNVPCVKPFQEDWFDHARIYKSKTGKVYLVLHNYDNGKPHDKLLDWINKNNLSISKEKVSWYSKFTSTYIIIA